MHLSTFSVAGASEPQTDFLLLCETLLDYAPVDAPAYTRARTISEISWLAVVKRASNQLPPPFVQDKQRVVHSGILAHGIMLQMIQLLARVRPYMIHHVTEIIFILQVRNSVVLHVRWCAEDAGAAGHCRACGGLP